jgi:hypothetical protein
VAAEAECLSDTEVRERRREREQERGAEQDQQYIEAFANRIRELFSHGPLGHKLQIAEHACRKYSGRVGRSAVAKSLDEESVHLAVIAHINHRETNCDNLLGQGFSRHEARADDRINVDQILDHWNNFGVRH